MREINLKDKILGLEGLDIILKNKPLEYGIDPNQGYNILVKGLPGTGKTTFGLALLDELSKKNNKKAEVLTMLEKGYQIFEICRIFGFFEMHKRLEDREIKDRLVVTEGDHRRFADLDFMLGKEAIRYLMIDGISAVKYRPLKEQMTFHGKIEEILDELKKRGAFTIIVSEEPRETEDRFFEYIVDGIIHLSVEGRERYLEISKLRWKDYYLGKHSLRLQSVERFPENYGVSIFPSIRCYFPESRKIKKASKIPSGICGFDRLVGEGFLPGEIILLMGEPGSGKTTFGMQFLKQKSGGKSLCISLEYTLEEIKQIYDSFKDEGLKEFIQGEDENYLFVYFNPSDSDFLLDEFSSKIISIVKTHNISRVLIDSVSSLKNRFTNIGEYASYISSLIRVLKNLNVTSILIWEMSSYFPSLASLETYNSEEVDTIIALRHYDFNNAISRGLVVLKSLGKEQNVALQNMYITPNKGLYLEEKGWAKIGLLSGQPESISEAKLFFKFFYQSKSHHEVEEGVFEEFKGRYPKETFTKVLKTNPSPTHWSFKGYYGAGHSNTKVISARKYVMDMLRKNGTLTPLPEDIYNKYRERFESTLLRKDKDYKESCMVPYYADVGVLVYQKVFLLALTEGITIENAKKEMEDKGKVVQYPKNWDEVKALKEKFLGRKDEFRQGGIYYLLIIPNTVADTRQFMTFFLELLLAHGGKMGPFETVYCTDLDECRNVLIENIQSPKFAETLEFMKDLVGDGRAVPNPNIGGNYHYSILSRRWYGKMELFEKDKRELEKKGKKLDFSIAPLPEIKSEIGSFSCLDLYFLGIIKGALAPETGWMFINELLEFYVDIGQCEQRRGLPIVKKEVYGSDLLKTSLRLDYSVINSILFPDDGKRKITTFRTSDIPYYYYIERLLAPIIKNIFVEGSSSEKIQEDIVKELNNKFVESYLSSI